MFHKGSYVNRTFVSQRVITLVSARDTCALTARGRVVRYDFWKALGRSVRIERGFDNYKVIVTIVINVT